ncbi:MAG: glycosyltransferase family 2 protein [Proteobacteria bacterium]|nr:glycosyltransferase family 2 protein [Pseudomonadota bacterium]NOG60710.1 glycosyltransferase family 2 protein [Pseudomonadota bacterium]
MAEEKKIIAVCVATFKRPELLNNCLSAIGQITIPGYCIPLIIVVDNDSEKSGRASFKKATKNIEFESYYYVEPNRGISSARNRLLKESLNHHADFIGFIDDDEFPHSDWLMQHMQTSKKYNADVVAGPVVPVFSNQPINKMPNNSKLNTGDTPRHVAAGNVLFRSKLATDNNLCFNTAYNFTGGEDFHFFDRSYSLGNVHVWSAEAIIYETIPEERRTKKYLFFRHFTGAINNVLQYKTNNNTFSVWFHFIIKIIGKIFSALVSAIIFLLTLNNSKLEKSIIKLASAIGYLCGLLNIIVERYR